jgi:thiamine biosynthesis lipoprotein
MRTITRIVLSVLLATVLLVPAGCGNDKKPVRVSRPALGTMVTIEAYGSNEYAVRATIDEAFQQIDMVEQALNSYSTTSAIAAVNRTPFQWNTLPYDAVDVLDRLQVLAVDGEFSPYLLGVVKLYDFGGENRVPTPGELGAALLTASMPERKGEMFRFVGISSSYAVPGLDFGGAAKGLALDRAREMLDYTDDVTAAIVSAGSTTVTLGEKPDGEPWRVGVEDPRQPGVILAVAEWRHDGALSTSGDYQQFFERDGVRYHHILDPKTGTPARGMRSLTIVGRFSGLDSDILSTALFVEGPEAALAYAKEHKLGCYIVDGEGRTHLAPAPADSGISLAEQSGE